MNVQSYFSNSCSAAVCSFFFYLIVFRSLRLKSDGKIAQRWIRRLHNIFLQFDFYPTMPDWVLVDVLRGCILESIVWLVFATIHTFRANRMPKKKITVVFLKMFVMKEWNFIKCALNSLVYLTGQSFINHRLGYSHCMGVKSHE